MKYTPEQIVKAHQYLYYVACEPVISDYVYDAFCRHHGIDGTGGSDLDMSYTDADRALARRLTLGEIVTSIPAKPSE